MSRTIIITQYLFTNEWVSRDEQQGGGINSRYWEPVARRIVNHDFRELYDRLSLYPKTEIPGNRAGYSIEGGVEKRTPGRSVDQELVRLFCGWRSVKGA